MTSARRDGVRDRLLDEAVRDSRIHAAAVSGSRAAGTEDDWSDIDLFLGVADADPAEVLDALSARLYRELGALHHFDLAAGSAIYRAFLLEGLLEVDLGLAPIDHFRAQGGAPFRVVFGDARPPGPAASGVDVDHAIGLIWHHLLHAHSSIMRGQPWRAEYWISATRDQILALASHRHELPTGYAKGADALPATITGPLEATLVRTLDRPGLQVAFSSVAEAAIAEMREHDPQVTDRLQDSLLTLAEI